MDLEHKIGLTAGIGYAGASVAMAAPSLGWYDSGELIASAFHLGVAHPTGFPTVMLGAKLMTFIPLGTVGLRTALLSALTASLAVGMMAAVATGISRSLGHERFTSVLSGIVAAVGLGCAPTIVQTATGLEAYAPSLALLTTMLAVTLLARRDALSPRDVLFVAFVFGLAASTHALLRIEGFLPLIWAFIACRRGSRRRLILFVVVAIALGSLVTLYLPLVSWRDPPLDWGDPESLHRLWDHLMGSRIRHAFADRMLNPSWWTLDSIRFAELIRSDVGLPLCALACLGLGGLLRQNRRAASLLVAVALTDGAYCVVLNPMGIPDRQVGMPTLAVLCTLAGVGTTIVSSSLQTMTRRRLVAVAVAVVGIVGQAVLVSSTWSGPGHGPSSMLSEALALPPRSVVLGSSDRLCGGLLWAQYVEGDRPDVLALPRQHLWDRSTLDARFSRHAPELITRLPRDSSGGLSLEAALDIVESARPVFWERGGDEVELRSLGHVRSLSAVGPPPLFRLDGEPSDIAEAAAALSASVRRWYGVPIPPDPAGRGAIASSYNALATAASEQRNDETARELLEVSLALEQRPTTLLNLSALEVRLGRYEEAWTLIKRALEVEPGNERALVAAGKLLLSQDRDVEAEEYFDRARLLCPSRCGAPLEGLGIIAARAGRYDEARSHLTEALRREPWLQDARTNLRLLDRVAPR